MHPQIEFTFQPPLTFPAFSIHEVCVRRACSGIIKQPHGLKEYAITLFHDAVNVCCHDTEHASSSPVVVIWQPDTPQSYGHPTLVWEYSQLICNGTLIRKHLYTTDVPCNVPIPCDNPAMMEAILMNLADELARSDALNAQLIEQLFAKLFRTIAELYRAQKAISGIPTALVEAKRYLETYFASPIQLTELADRANLSVEYFSRAFRKHYNASPINFLINIRMQHAATLLSRPNCTMQVKAIGAAVGYDNAQHFSIIFRQHFGVSPSKWRDLKQLENASELAQAHVADAHDSERWLREDWQEVVAYDFTRDHAIDQHFVVYHYLDENLSSVLFAKPERIQISDSQLTLLPLPGWTMLRWDDTFTDDIKLDIIVMNTATDGLNICLAIGGDNRNGYRLRLENYHHIVLETTRHGFWEILSRCACTLNPQAESYHITFWCSQHVYYADIDGQRVLTYFDSLACCAMPHNTFAISRLYGHGSCDIRELRVYTRQRPLYSDIFEPGRVLHERGYTDAAYQWFLDLSRTRKELSVSQEAQYLAAAILPVDAPQKEALLAAIADDGEHPFYTRSLRALAIYRSERHNYAGAVEATRRLYTHQADSDLSQQIANTIISAIKEASDATREQLFTQLVQLPLECLHLCDLGLQDLSPIRRMPLRELRVTNNAITTLTPLSSMPLIRLHCEMNQIVELNALHGMPLIELICSHNRIRDLSPCSGLPLQVLVCNSNELRSLAPLAGLALKHLQCSYNPIDSLESIHRMPLEELACHSTVVADLTPLRGLPLQHLACDDTPIADLCPVRDLPLRTLSCRNTRITDLSPLRGKSITRLDITGIPLSPSNLAVLRTLPCQQLGISLAETPLELILEAFPQLHSVNNYLLAYVRELGQLTQQALQAWRSGASASALREALRSHAQRYGHTLYLALPIKLNRHDAASLVQWLGGNLPRVESLAAYEEIRAYLATKTLCLDIFLCHIHDIAARNDVSTPAELLNAHSHHDASTYPCCCITSYGQVPYKWIYLTEHQYASVIITWEYRT